MTDQMIRVLMITSEWPTADHPHWVPFLVRQVESLRSAGVDISLFHFRGAKNPFRYLRSWIELRKRFHISGFDLIHAQFGQSGLLALPKRIPLIVTFHGSDVLGYVNDKGEFTLSGKLLRLVSQWVAMKADEVIVVAEHLNRFLKSKKQAQVIPCGVNLEKFAPISQKVARQHLDLPEDGKIILFVGDPQNPIKRFELAKAAVEMVQTRTKNASLLVVSGVDPDMIPFYLNAGDVLLITSRHEGSPTIIKEALACNLPIASVDVGDVAVQLKNCDGSIVCSQDTPEAISDALHQILANGRPANARTLIQDLDERVIANRIIQLYQSVRRNSR